MKSISLLKFSFSYSSSEDLLVNISAVFDDRSKIAIIGNNGCGKTTLLKLISGKLEPACGAIVRNASVYLIPQVITLENKSGGERQQAELAMAFASDADILLLDEPTNNLDSAARKRFFTMLHNWRSGAIIISHDRELLNQIDKIIELSGGSIRVFGGNYDFYSAVKNAEHKRQEALCANTENRIAQLNETLRIAQDTRHNHEAKQKKDFANSAKGPKILANGLKGKSKETEARACCKIQKKLDEKFDARQRISESLRDDKIKIPMPAAPFFRKELIMIENLCFGYSANIFQDFSFQMHGLERIRIAGNNGSGKTTLLKLLLGQLNPNSGRIKLFGRAAYLNQDLSLLNPQKTIVENIMELSNTKNHDARAIAANFGFRGSDANRRAGALSGGELLKAALATVLGGRNPPDLLILDEPTNNLDIKSIRVLEDALNQYAGAILLVSHDERFIKSLEIDRTIWL